MPAAGPSPLCLPAATERTTEEGPPSRPGTEAWKDNAASRRVSEKVGYLPDGTMVVIQGGRDLLVPPSAARDVAEHIPGARMEVLREASHLPYMSHPEAFNEAVHEIAHITAHLLDSLVTTAPPKNRDEEAAKAKVRAAVRYGAAG